MKVSSLLSIFFAVAVVVSAEFVHFHDHSVLKYELKDEGQIRLVQLLGLDVWSHDSIPIIGINDIMVTPAQKKILEDNGIFHKSVMIADVEQSINNEREANARLHASADASWFDSYHRLEEIFAFYQNLSTSNLITYIPSIGKSIQGRDIPALTLGNPQAKKRFYFEGGQHAREWVSHTTVAYIVSQLVDDPAGLAYLDKVFFVVVPVVNVDGYVFTWDSNRLWRKNRRQNTGGSFGVDLNRNWNDHWGGEGASKTPTSDTYCGTAPFSEPETKAVSDYYLSHAKTAPFNGAIDFHSYSQLILRPTGWTTTPPVTDAQAKLVGDGIRDRIRTSGGVQYTSEASWELYFTAGTAQDWWFSEGSTTNIALPLSYTIELRDTGTYGFQLPANQIIPTGKENWEGFKYFIDYILKQPDN